MMHCYRSNNIVTFSSPWLPTTLKCNLNVNVSVIITNNIVNHTITLTGRVLSKHFADNIVFLYVGTATFT